MKLRKWQRLAREVIERIRLGGGDRALIAASPGSGKTLFTVSVVLDDMRDVVSDGVIVVAPSKAIKRLWKRAFKVAGIEALTDIDNGTLEERHRRGMELFDPARPVLIVTYGQVARFPEMFAVLCARHRMFAVFDEIHHADDEAAFGEKLIEAFTDAGFKLSLSGTPFNTSGGQLAFCRCEPSVNDEGKHVSTTLADFTWSYGEALQAEGTEDDPNVVRPVTFIKWNGFAKWRFYNEDTKKVEDRIIDGTKKSDSLTPLLDPDLDSLPKMIGAALAELEEIRRHDPNAAMLIAARDSDHCLDIAKLLHQRFGVQDSVIIRYDIPNAHHEIERFEKSKDRVIIAIKMLSEGVDIKRLRVGVYASDIKTRMFFTQFIGRFVRWDGNLPETQYASVFIPEHVTLIKYAQEIEQMIASAIIPDPRTGDGGGSGARRSRLIDKEGDGRMNGAITHGSLIDQIELSEARDVRQAAGLDCDLDIVLRILTAAKRGQSDAAPDATQKSTEEHDPWKSNDKLVGRIVAVAKGMGRDDLTHASVNTMANRHVGIAKKDKLTPRVTVEQREEFLRGLLVSLYESADVVANT